MSTTGGFVILFGLTGFCDPAFRGVCLHDGRCDHSLLDVAGNFLDDCMFGHCCSKQIVLQRRCAGRWMRKHYRWNIVRLTLSDFSIHMNVNGFKAFMILWFYDCICLLLYWTVLWCLFQGSQSWWYGAWFFWQRPIRRSCVYFQWNRETSRMLWSNKSWYCRYFQTWTFIICLIPDLVRKSLRLA